jgi:hypothetical protein
LLTIYIAMPSRRKKILVIDEKGFCRVCSAILKIAGYGMETLTNPHGDDLSIKLCRDNIGLIITSYPYGHLLLQQVRKSAIPFIILTDNIDKDLMSTLNGLSNSYCMIKPIDYRKFRKLVMEIMSGYYTARGGYAIV